MISNALDWLRGDPREPPAVVVAGRQLPVIVRRLDRARRMTLRLSPDGSEVRVTIPQWGRTAEAVSFARTRSDWLAAQLGRIPVAEPVGAGSTISVCGQPVTIAHRPGSARRPVLTADTLSLGGPAESVARRVKRWLEDEARARSAADLEDYCARAGCTVPRLALSGAQRRWGSCSPGGSIRINWRLVMAPDAVRRSVVAHEVAHLVHFDHSPRFYALLVRIYEGDLAAANTWLKSHGRSLYAPFG